MRNEERFIERCLAALRQQDYPASSYEVIVVDGLSTDSSPQIVSELEQEWPNLRIVSNPEQVIPTGLNVGLREARGEIIVRVDAHTIVAPDYVSTCVRHLQQGRADNVGGLMRPVGESYIGRAIALAMKSPFGVGPGKFHYSEKEEYVDTVYLGAYYRSTLLKLGGYDTNLLFAEDDELNFRLQKTGGRVLLVPEIHSVYYCRSSLRGLSLQYFNYGRSKVRTMIKHRGLASYRHFVPVAFTGAIMGGALGSLFCLPVRVAWLLVIGAYGLVNGLFSLRIAAHDGWRCLPILPVVFFNIHLGYGLGFLVGCIDLAIARLLRK